MNVHCIPKCYFVLLLSFFLMKSTVLLPATDEQNNTSNSSTLTKEALQEILILKETIEKRLKEKNIIIEGKVLDEKGDPLNDVSVVLEFERPSKIITLSDVATNETKKLKTKINSVFSFSERGYNAVHLLFFKEGYNEKTIKYQIDLLSDKGDNENIVRRNLLIVLKKNRPASQYMEYNHVQMKYDFCHKTKRICDLSTIETGIVMFKDIPFDQEYNGVYLELDLDRDKNNNILLGDKYQKKQYPLNYILRIHSDNPKDGFIPAEQISDEAPDLDYPQREISLMLGQSFSAESFQKSVCAYIKVGGHYGKVNLMFPKVLQELSEETFEYHVSGYSCSMSLFFNTKKEERKLSK